MFIKLGYPHDPATGAPKELSLSSVRAVAAQMRAQLPTGSDRPALDAATLAGAVQHIEVNGRAVFVAWNLAQDLRDDLGHPVLGVCHMEPDTPGVAYVLINRRMTADRPDLAASTAAHELGHVIFDVPAMVERPERRYRTVVTGPGMLDSATRAAERRANEFMGALLVPPMRVHTQLLTHARSEGLRLTRAPNLGRPGSPVVARGNPSEAVAGVIAALAGDFGVSERFITVRLDQYGLIGGVQS